MREVAARIGRAPRAPALALALVLGANLVVEAAHAQDRSAVEIRPRADTTVRRPPPISPLGAFGRSLILPGWAQAELEAPGRGAFYFLMEATSLWMWFRTQQRLDHARRTLPEDDGLIESRKQQREDWIALSIFWAFFSAADGWVSVHLWGFEEITGRRPPDGEVSIDLGWKIPFSP